MDAQYQAELSMAQVNNTQYLGDALPVAYPNPGPVVFSGFYGGNLILGITAPARPTRAWRTGRKPMRCA